MADKNLTIEVIYDDNGATAKLKQLDRAVEGVGTTADTQTTPAVSRMSGVMKAALVGAAVAAVHEVGQLAMELMRMGDEIQRVSDRTGLSIKAVQQLGFAATQSGNSLEQITAAIGQMQNRLASGDKSAVAALQALNLSLQDLRALTPDAQFYAIAEAIAAVEDPMVRTQLAMDVFGRWGMATLPTITAELKKLRDEAPVMADATVKALNKAGDRIDAIGLKAKVAAAEGFNKLYESAKLLFDYFGDGGPRVKMSDTPGKDIRLAPEQMLTDYTVAVTAATAATTGAHRETRVLTTELATVAVAAQTATVAFRTLDGVLVQIVPPAAQVGEQFKFLGWYLEPLVSRDLPLMIAELPMVAQNFTLAGQAATAARGPIGAFFDAIKTGGQGLVEGLTGGNGLAGFFANIGFGITQQLGSILMTGISRLISWGIDKAWEGIKAIGRMFSNLFGPGQEWTDVKSARAAFEGQFGGYEGFMRSIGEAYTAGGQSNQAAEAAILNFWNAKDMATLNIAMKVLQDALAGKFGASGGGFLPGEYNPNAELPSFASGGVGDFGRGTLAMLHGREAIVPLDRPGRFGGTTVIINNPDIDSQVGMDRFARRLESVLNRAQRRQRVA
jgi:hypothetical protein